jgi:hypothetical protein
MAPEWARATRPLVAIFTAITFFVTIQFNANVDAQGGAYATGVLVLMTSAAVAVTSLSWRDRRRERLVFLLITIVFVYTTIANIFEHLARVTALKGRYDRILKQGQAQEARWLDQLGRDLAAYRQENLAYRTDGVKPRSFDTDFDFPLALAAMKEILDNDA